MRVAGVGPKLREDGRRVLEAAVFEWVRDTPGFDRSLLVGCHWYTRRYEKLLAPLEVSTIEIDPSRRRCQGATYRHVSDSVEFAGRHFDAGSMDFVSLSGVIGWGLDDPEVADRSVAALARTLRPGGVLLIGVNNLPANRPFALDTRRALAVVKPWVFSPLTTAVHRCSGDMRKVFHFSASRGEGVCGNAPTIRRGITAFPSDPRRVNAGRLRFLRVRRHRILFGRRRRRCR